MLLTPSIRSRRLLLLGGALFAVGLLSACEALPVADDPPVSQAAFECPPAARPASVTEHCPEARVVEKVVVKTLEVPVEVAPQRAGELKLPIIGAVERAQVEPPGITLEARIDTGAETTSIHAEAIQLVEIDGKRYARYTLVDPATGDVYPMESRLRRRVLIKQQEGERERRLVVRMWVTLGETRLNIDVTLTDRSDMEYPLLIGRNMLTDVAIVDVGRHHTLTN